MINELSNTEVLALLGRYWNNEKYPFPGYFEHRYDPDSSAILYSFVRELKPKKILEIGTSKGGATLTIMKALLKNNLPFEFYSSELLDDLRNEAENNLKREAGQSPIMLGDITKNLDKIPYDIDFFMLDNDHDLPTTVWIMENIIPRLKDGCFFSLHDWAVQDINGKWVGKGHEGAGAWPETQYFMDLQKEGKFPFKKIWWGYKNPLWEGFWDPCESSFWVYAK